MDRDVTLYQITSVMAERVFQKIDNFNKGRREDAGFYAISVSTPYRSYYALWRIFPDNITLLCLFSRWQLHLMMRQSVLFSICRIAMSC